ncbi:hypothetical protein WICPIJ_007260 [Wickerhamomyces pijperi]|uniref:Uncharacterized protein n=1 Tax=Wickerhamomyces pijperi TaxID=599730 RepID=A0A9P8Q222_WICPI|nr:hypothetical protein WICPIJ_007260 [Wickerhamomyces pijperi]
MTESTATSIIKFYLQSPSSANSITNFQTSATPLSGYQLYDLLNNNNHDKDLNTKTPIAHSPSLNSPNSAKELGGNDTISIKINTCDLKSGSTFYDNIEKLPTALDSLNPNSGLVYLIHNGKQAPETSLEDERQDLNNSKSKGAAGQSNNSPFFTIPFRNMFRKNKEKLVATPQVIAEAENESPLHDSQAIAVLDIIQDSPFESLLQDFDDDFLQFTDNLEDIEGKVVSSDPIYENYVRYTHRSQDFEEDEDKEGAMRKPNKDSSYSISNLGFPTVFGDPKRFIDNPFLKQNESDNEATMDSRALIRDGSLNSIKCNPGLANENLELGNNSDIEVLRSSTLTRIKTRTKSFLREVSKHYDNEFKTLNDNTAKLKNDLKRRFSSSSLRLRNSGWNLSGNYTSELEADSPSKEKRVTENKVEEPLKKWGEWRTRSGKSLSLNMRRFSNSERSLNTGTDLPAKGKSLMDLFDSPDYKERLKDGQIHGRKSYEKENESESAIEDSFQVSYKYLTKNSYEESSLKRQNYFKNALSFRKPSVQSLNGTSSSNINSSRTERSHSLKLLLRRFGNSPNYANENYA